MQISELIENQHKQINKLYQVRFIPRDSFICFVFHLIK